MQKHTVYIFFSEANSIEANQVVEDLKNTNITCIVDKPTTEKVQELIQDKEATGLLLVSDNYLKSIEATTHLDQLLEDELSDQLIPVIIHGRRLKVGTSDQMEVYPTKIQTLNNVMYYRDFWYEEWIALRKKSKVATAEEQEVLDVQKEIAKKMSVGSISNYIRKINSAEPLDWDEFCEDGYQILFDQADLGTSSVEERSKNDSEEIPTIDIPVEESSNELETDTTVNEEVTVVDEVEETTEAMAPLDQEGALGESEEVEETTKEEEEVLSEVIEETMEVKDESEVDEEETEIDSEEVLEEKIEDVLSETDESIKEEDLSELIEEVNEDIIEETISEPSIQVEEEEEKEEETLVEEEELPFTMEGLKNLEEIDAQAILSEYKIEEVDDIDTLFHIAESNAEEGDFEDARRTYERILTLDPYNGRALIWLARLLARHYEGEAMEAAHLYRKSIMVNDENASLYYEYALLQKEHFKSYNKASDSFREALLIDSMFEDAYLGLAQCQREMGMLDQAKANYLQACVLDAPKFQTAENDTYFGVLRVVEEIEEADEVDAVALEEVEMERSPNADTVVMVTGASSGIGQAIAGQFIMAGYKVIITGRRAERLNEFKQLMEEHLEEAHIHSLSFDVCDLDAVKAALDSLPEEWANVDVLINNAGLAKGLASIHDGNVDHWETMINTNVKGLLYMTRMVTPGMVERKKGHVINLGSVAGTQVYPGGGVYCATKAAVDSLTRSMRLDLYQHNIKVTCVSPGHVDSTEFAEVRYDDKEKANIYDDFKPLSARDVAETIFYVATRPEHVNIQDILMFGTQQASVRDVNRSGRNDD